MKTGPLKFFKIIFILQILSATHLFAQTNYQFNQNDILSDDDTFKIDLLDYAEDLSPDDFNEESPNFTNTNENQNLPLNEELIKTYSLKEKIEGELKLNSTEKAIHTRVLDDYIELITTITQMKQYSKKSENNNLKITPKIKNAFFKLSDFFYRIFYPQNGKNKIFNVFSIFKFTEHLIHIQDYESQKSSYIKKFYQLNYIDFTQNSFPVMTEAHNGMIISNFSSIPLGEGKSKIFKLFFHFNDLKPVAFGELKDLSEKKSIMKFKNEIKIYSDLAKMKSRSPSICPKIIHTTPKGILLEYFPMNLDSAFYEIFQAKEEFNVLFKLSCNLVDIHDAGINHIDIKPDNVLVRPIYWTTGKVTFDVVFTDFDLAENVEETVKLKRNRNMKGTARYIAPELVLDDLRWFGNTDKERVFNALKTDVFSLGLLAHILINKNIPNFISPDQDLIKSNRHINMFDMIYQKIRIIEKYFEKYYSDQEYNPFQELLFGALRESPYDRLDGQRFFSGLKHINELIKLNLFPIQQKQKQNIFLTLDQIQIIDFMKAEAPYLNRGDYVTFVTGQENETRQAIIWINNKNKAIFKVFNFDENSRIQLKDEIEFLKSIWRIGKPVNYLINKLFPPQLKIETDFFINSNLCQPIDPFIELVENIPENVLPFTGHLQPILHFLKEKKTISPPQDFNEELFEELNLENDKVEEIQNVIHHQAPATKNPNTRAILQLIRNSSPSSGQFVRRIFENTYREAIYSPSQLDHQTNQRIQEYKEKVKKRKNKF
jgi:serine/threonine protein kinase